MAELITIVIIGRNEQQNVARCIESCLDCDWPNKEIIYCDSESTDKTVEIAKRYPIRVIVHKNEKRNPSVGRNVGLRAARAKYVYFIDGDMTLRKDFLSAAFPVLLSDEGNACVVGIREETRMDNFYVRLIDSSYHNYSTFGEVPSPSGGGGLFKRRILLEAGGYFEDFMASEEEIVGLKLRELGYRTILIGKTMAYHDVGVHSFGKYVWFRARQGMELANTLLHRQKILPGAYRVSVKHIVEFFAMMLWFVCLLVVDRLRIPYVIVSMSLLLAWYAYKFYRIRKHTKRWLFFIHEFVLGKPIHIISEVYYLVMSLLTRRHMVQK